MVEVPNLEAEAETKPEDLEAEAVRGKAAKAVAGKRVEAARVKAEEALGMRAAEQVAGVRSVAAAVGAIVAEG